MRPTHPILRVLPVLVALLAALTCVETASADTVELAPVREGHGVAVFSLTGVDAHSIESAYMREGSRRRRIGLARVRDGAHSGALRVRVSRRTRGTRTARASGRGRPRLILFLARPSSPYPPSLPAPFVPAGGGPEGGGGSGGAGGSGGGGGSGGSGSGGFGSGGGHGPAESESGATDPDASEGDDHGDRDAGGEDGGGDDREEEYPAPDSGRGRIATFETGNFSQVDDRSALGGDISVTDDRAYTGTHAAMASSNGDEGFQRVWYDVNWADEDEVWYGAAYYVPDRDEMPCWAMLARWDNFKSFGRDGDTGGVELEDGKIRLVRGGYDGSNYQRLSSSVDVPEGRWFWLEVHQRLSDKDGEAENELYIDGDKVGSSDKANSAGRKVDNVRFGYSALRQECADASKLYFDDVSISDERRGPR